MAERRIDDDKMDEAQRREADRQRGAMDPGLKEQFERDRPVVRERSSDTPDADTLQRPHN